MNQSTLVVLDAALPAERREWLRRWRGWPAREPMGHPTYAALFAKPEDRVVCLASGTDNEGVLFPLVIRPLRTAPWAHQAEDRWDATTPYGYGGPFSWGRSAPSDGQFWRNATRWLHGEKVVTLFVRLSLFPEDRSEYLGDAADLTANVVRSLECSAEALWMDYAHKVRKNVNAARRAGLEFELDIGGKRLEDFLAIYHATMDRRAAAAQYHFSRDFFERLIREMPEAVAFAHILDAGKPVSTEILLRSPRRLYSFLGGTRSDAFEKRPNDLLKHEVADWGRKEGLSAFVLGGGYAGEDGIYHYKRAFAPHGSVPFKVGRVTLDPAAAAELTERRREYEASRGIPWAPTTSFFPPYRAGPHE